MVAAGGRVSGLLGTERHHPAPAPGKYRPSANAPEELDRARTCVHDHCLFLGLPTATCEPRTARTLCRKGRWLPWRDLPGPRGTVVVGVTQHPDTNPSRRQHRGAPRGKRGIAAAAVTNGVRIENAKTLKQTRRPEVYAMVVRHRHRVERGRRQGLDAIPGAP